MEVYLFYSSECLFSNFHPLDFVYKGVKYNCGEQAFMHHKALLFEDVEVAKEIMELPYNPKRYKKLGKKVRNYDDSKWSEVRVNLMEDLIRARCEYNEEYKDLLLSLKGRGIAEASPMDTIWGIGFSSKNPKSLDPKLWRGKNLLGNAYMKVRDELLSSDE